MCDFHTDLPPLETDEYRLDTPPVRGFVADETSPFRSGYVNAECITD